MREHNPAAQPGGGLSGKRLLTKAQIRYDGSRSLGLGRRISRFLAFLPQRCSQSSPRHFLEGTNRDLATGAIL